MTVFICIHCVFRGGRHLRPGDLIALLEQDARPLLALGAIERVHTVADDDTAELLRLATAV